MLFNSLQYAIFLPIVFIIYWAIPHKYRWIILFIASYYFYMSWNPKYVVLILGTTIISYLAGIMIEKSESKSEKKMILTIALVICLGVLFIFKYFNFAIESFCNLIKFTGIKLQPITLKLLLPVGISFYTFQTLAYVVDVYRGDVKAEKHFGYYATFISFFPQLVAGPIERTSNLLPQIKRENKFIYEDGTYGLKLIAWGLFKKMIIADYISTYVQTIYDSPSKYFGFSLILATVLFTFEIYCDFSGYSDIAIGSANLLGIKLMDNFKSPYFSQSIKEFWSRWHISLSTWFRDYVYIPLGGNRVSKFRHHINLVFTFLVSGLWHGANVTFVIWGAVHGVAQVIENCFFNKKSNKVNFIKIFMVFIFVGFAWIFFVSNNLSDSLHVIAHCFDGINAPIDYLKCGFKDIQIGKTTLVKIIILFTILLAYDFISLKEDVIDKISKMKPPIRWLIYVAFIMFCFISIKVKGSNEFLYFQF